MLTKKKAKWVASRRPEMLRGSPINPPTPVAMRYNAELQDMIKQMTAETQAALEAIFDTEHAQEYFAQDASTASQANIVMNALIKKFTMLFNTRSKPIAKRFASASNRASSKATHSSLKELSGGLSLGTRKLDADTKEIMTATIAENVGLIKTIPQKYLAGVQGAVMRSITTGNGMQTLLPYIKKHKGITERRAHFIAIDQTRKANVALTVGRMEKIGLKKGRWIHTGGGKTSRELHEELDGTIFEFANPPVIQKNPTVRGLPGQLPGCRCRFAPVIEFDD